MLTEVQLFDIVAELRDPQSAISCSLKVACRYNITYAALCRLRLLKTGKQLDIPVDIEPDAIERMWEDRGRDCNYLPVWPLNVISEAAQRMKDGLRMSEFWRENHLKDALKLANRELAQLLEKPAAVIRYPRAAPARGARTGT